MIIKNNALKYDLNKNYDRKSSSLKNDRKNNGLIYDHKKLKKLK